MGEAGVFAPDARLELIEGEILEMAPIHPPHAGTVNILNAMFVRLAADHAVVAVQNPAVIAQTSMPQPDFALLKPRRDGYRRKHPTAADVLLAVEVADTTLKFDTGRKAHLYARCGIRELWVVDVNARAIRVFRDPTAAGYETVSVVPEDARVTAGALPQVTVAVADLFPD